MGQQLFMYISNQCDSFADTYSPGIQTTGMHILMAMATAMLVWFGIQEALASAQGGPGFNMAKFMNFFLLITFAYCFTSFYNGSIPGLGFLPQIIHRSGNEFTCRHHRQRLESPDAANGRESPAAGRLRWRFPQPVDRCLCRHRLHRRTGRSHACSMPSAPSFSPTVRLPEPSSEWSDRSSFRSSCSRRRNSYSGDG